MIEPKSIAARMNAIAEGVAKEHGVELVHAEIAGSKRDSVVRIFIDKKGGVGIEDCSRFSGAMEELLDAEDLIPWAYVLEISSPGIERSLYSVKDYVRFAGELAKVKTLSEIDGQKNFVGRIEAVEGDEVIFEDRTVGSVRIPFASIEKANLKIDLAKEFGGRPQKA
ncbi:MAG: ribosome maturation factor RimP [Acidobacteriota bacterium]